MSAADIIEADSVELPENLAAALRACRQLVSAGILADNDLAHDLQRSAARVFRTVNRATAPRLFSAAVDELYSIATAAGMTNDDATQQILDAAPWSRRDAIGSVCAPSYEDGSHYPGMGSETTRAMRRPRTAMMSPPAPIPSQDDYGTITAAKLPATINDTTAVAPAKLISPAAWPNEAPPPVDWLVTARIPRGDVTTLHGDGGAGKTDIALRLAANVARGASDWLGHEIAAGKVLFVSGEEPERELRRRMWLHSQRDGYRLDELADNFRLWMPNKISDAAMAISERHGSIMQPTRIMQEIAAAILDFAPVLVIVDNVAATFAGNQNDRVMVRSYVNLWRQIAHGPSKPAVLLLDHPSLSGLTNSTGRGGNMDWRNAVRSALYLRIPDDKAEADRGIRILETAKSNYGPTGNPLRLVWADGGLQLEHAPSSHHRAAKEQQCEETFLRLLDERNGQGSHVGRKTSGMYAPKVFATTPDNGGLSKSAFAAAMERLLQSRCHPRGVWTAKRRGSVVDYIDRAASDHDQQHRSQQSRPGAPVAGTLQPIATVRSYDDLRRVVADHCERIAMSRMELDAEAGLTDGHSAKLLSAHARKKLGIVTLGRVMAAAGLVLIVAIDPDAPHREFDASKAASRSQRYDRTKHWRRDRSSSAWGKRMAALRALALTAEQRSEIARNAANARHRRRATPAGPAAE